MKIDLADPYRHVVSTDRYLLLWQEEEVTKQKQMGPGLSIMEFEDTQPVRAGHSYQHRRHYEGMYPVISTGQVVWYESMLELQCLMQLEHAGDLAGISTQPFCLVGPDRFRHYPDFFYRRGFDGAGVVVDVRAADRIDEGTRARYELTAALCREVGWAYEVMHGLTSWAAMDLEWLSAFRHPRFALADPVLERLMPYITNPRPFDDAARLIDFRAPEAGKAALYHLMWTREVVTVSDGPLYEDMLIMAAEVAA
ncbi:TnsA-like heteromeric transposase endonuclease subunit [Kocuria sp. WRN011]|uniref:TnsA-like heteromeric transposase endonuclease subunit n=1 Tax=Kocuria sp. WRN011 TaxID=2029858 RepID=UPI001304277B|nr:TnsA-like heteromeric transposase endonuclease subunit [Kocuria sp. WRN011]